MADSAVVKFSAEEMQSRIEDFPSKEKDEDDESANFGLCYIICLMFSLITYILDWCVHCWLAYLYYTYGQVTIFVITVIFIMIPALVTNAFSLRWYINDVDEPTIPPPPIWKWIIRVIVLLFQIAPVLRYCDALLYGVKSKKARTNDNILHVDGYYLKMLDEDSNAVSLRLFHCFLFAAPQAVVQLTAVITTLSQKLPLSMLTDFQILGVVCSFVSMAWSIATYQRSARFARDDKENLSFFGTGLLFLWNFSFAVSRVLAMSVVASLYPIWLGSACIVHWLVMGIWLILTNSNTTICGSWCEEIALSLMLSFAYILIYISPRDGRTRYTYLVYYLVCFLENTGALVVWCLWSSTVSIPTLYYGVVVAQVSTFAIGVFLMLTYYAWIHPAAMISRFHFHVKHQSKWIGGIRT